MMSSLGVSNVLVLFFLTRTSAFFWLLYGVFFGKEPIEEPIDSSAQADGLFKPFGL